MLKNKSTIVIIILSLLWALISVVGGTVFIRRHYGEVDVYKDAIGKGQQIFWFIVAVFIACLLIYLFVSFLVNAIKNDGKERRIILYSLPFLGVLLSYFFLMLLKAEYNVTYYEGDEILVWNSATNLYPFFFVYLSEIYIISFLIFPCVVGPTLVKIIMEALIMGYIVYRVRKHYKSNGAYLIFLMCMMEPFYTLGVEAHRMQWYGFIYLFVFSKLFFDIIEDNIFEKEDGKKMWLNIAPMIALIALLSVFRREGMYFYVLGPILIILAYWRTGLKKTAIVIVAVTIAAEIVVNIPVMQNGMSEKGLALDALIVHMLGDKTFDEEKAEPELDVLRNEFDFEKIDKWNQERAADSFDSNAFDVPGWADNAYWIHRSDSTVTTEQVYDAFKAIVIKQPLPFIRSRLVAFLVAGRGEKAWNLYFPLFILMIEFIYSIIHFNKKPFLLFVGIIIHIGLTTLAMPASFFKYYFHMWLVTYVFLIVIVLDYIKQDKYLIYNKG